MAPVVAALREQQGVEPVVCTTAQHREMVDQVQELFGLVPDLDLDLMTADQQLNDLVNDQGTLYVSDSKGRKVYQVKDGKPSVWLDEQVLKGPNGLFVHKGSLYVLDDNSLNRVEKDRSLKVLASGMNGGVDGLENVKGDDFIVSAWGGSVWYVAASGDKQLVFDGKAENRPTPEIPPERQYQAGKPFGRPQQKAA